MRRPVEHVDLNGRVLEIVPRSRMRRENLRHRSAVVIVTNNRGELLVHRRADDKDLFPGWWDLAAGGVVGVAESYTDSGGTRAARGAGRHCNEARVRDGRPP